MEDGRIGRRYAQALFDVAKRTGNVRGIESDLDAIASLYRNDLNFRELLILPSRSKEEKIAKLNSLFGDAANGITLQVLRVMVEKDRESEITAVRDEFVKLRREDEGTVFARVVSAVVLLPEEKDAVVAKVAAALGKRVEATFAVDPSVLGGVRVEYDNYVMDGTVQGALDRLRDRLRHDLLRQN